MHDDPAVFQDVAAVGEPERRFKEDYLRILRCARFAARLEFTVVQSTWEAAVAAAPGLRMLSAERVRDEWFKSLATTFFRLCSRNSSYMSRRIGASLGSGLSCRFCHCATS